MGNGATTQLPGHLDGDDDDMVSAGATTQLPGHLDGDDDDMVSARINCSPYIDCSDISSFLKDHHDSLLERDRQVLQCCLSVILGEPTWVWERASLHVYGSKLAVMFYSNDKANKYVVCINRDDIRSQCVSRGFRLKMKDGFRSVWNWIGNAAGAILGAVGGAGRKMLTY
ncbi:uncharacterized protein LOC125376907 isoform X2 [Haliotis rufescens]|uniref:uncharacterized protein LOC125376907 isoform X2 n=1 Tax=Haliotis rufescens TaxID=6454 RepID=UPI00201EE810|nr:uncharacterized protein LOC125376907 isoform X2 [Haliotis rufescens]